MRKKTIIQLGLFAAGLYGLWWLWENDAAINAVVVFSTAGVVPGTRIVLSPEQVYVVLGGILGVAIIGIFWKQWVRAARFTRQTWRTTWREQTTHQAQAEHMAEPQTNPPIVETAKPVIIAVPVHSRLTRTWQRMRPKVIIVVGTTLEVLVRILQRLAVTLSRLAFKIYEYGVRGWLRVEPYLRRFDAWLERTLKANKDIAAFLHVLRELTKAAQLHIAAWRARFGRPARTPEE